MKLSSLQKLATLNLTTEQMAGVIAVLVDELSSLEETRTKERDRSARYRERLGISTVEWGELRVNVLKRDDYCCQYCGEYANTCDHVIPLAANGPTNLENLVAACDKCNSSKRDRPVTEWEAPQWR